MQVNSLSTSHLTNIEFSSGDFTHLIFLPLHHCMPVGAEEKYNQKVFQERESSKKTVAIV